MDPSDIPTRFAPAARSAQAEIDRQARVFQGSEILKNLTDAVPNILFILNHNRQIVHANRMILGVLEVEDTMPILGLRPGEALRCAHAFESEGGCGTTEYCQTCGAVRAILTSQRGEGDIQECRILQEHNLGALDLRIVATPMKINGEQFTVFAATDVSDEKRREALERIFFHDVLNTAAGVQGYVDLLQEISTEKRDEVTGTARQLVRRLIGEIRSQRELTDAERGGITLESVRIESHAFLASLIELYRMHHVADSRTLVCATHSQNITLRCDERLLQRVVGNMIKNALEASAKGTTVTVGCRAEGRDVEFWVHNVTSMPRDIQLQVFQRSFSTKGVGRGLGTYSMKLLGEKYLGGKVAFTSSPDHGTTFRITLPVEPSSRS